MNEIDDFIRDAAHFAGVEPQALLAKVLHVEDGAFAAVVASMNDSTRSLAIRLDREIRIRNPGLHYVERRMFLGYRREGHISASEGERSQIFLSLIRSNTRLELVLTVATETMSSIPYAQDLTGRGHHGVGNARVLLTTVADLERFLSDFDSWLRNRG